MSLLATPDLLPRALEPEELHSHLHQLSIDRRRRQKRAPAADGRDRLLLDDELLARYAKFRLHRHLFAALGPQTDEAAGGHRAADRMWTWERTTKLAILKMAEAGDVASLHQLLERCLTYVTDLRDVGFEDVLLPWGTTPDQDPVLGERIVPAAEIGEDAPLADGAKWLMAAMLYLTGALKKFGAGDQVLIRGASAKRLAEVVKRTRANVFRILREEHERSQYLVRQHRSRPKDGEGKPGKREVTTPDGNREKTRVGAAAHPTNEYVVLVSDEILEMAARIESTYGPTMDPVEWESVSQDEFMWKATADRSQREKATAVWNELKQRVKADAGRRIDGKWVAHRYWMLMSPLWPLAFDGYRLIVKGPVYPVTAQLIERYAREMSIVVRLIPSKRPKGL